MLENIKIIKLENIMRILIVEENENLGVILRASFERENFIVDLSDNYENGAYLGRINEYDAIIIDSSPEQSEAQNVCRRIRDKKSSVPIIILSSALGIRDKINFFNIGADDCLIKPFSFQEILARTQSILKRPKEIILGNKLEIGNMFIDRKKHQIKCCGKELVLSRKEFILLSLLLEKNGEVVSRSEMLENVWEGDVDPFSNTIETHIASIRRKIEKSGGGKIIKTISGVGYKIEA